MRYIRNIGNCLAWCFIASFAWVWVSCDEFCEVSNRTAIVVNFFSAESHEQINVSVRVTGINVDGAGRDSLLYPNNMFPQQSRDHIILPLNPNADEMIFMVEVDDLLTDTITFRYTPHVGFISVECGCAVFAQINEEQLEWTENAIINVEVTNSKVNTVLYRQGILNDENIRIYY